MVTELVTEISEQAVVEGHRSVLFVGNNVLRPSLNFGNIDLLDSRAAKGITLGTILG